MSSELHNKKAKTERRFSFGQNWSSFLKSVNEDSLNEASRSLVECLGRDNLEGLGLLDIGCGSGLFSLAARRLGAIVHSFDFDADSVICTLQLRAKYFPKDPRWIVEHGSILDEGYISQLKLFDIVYSWGVLHHTGRMWQAVANAASLVRPNGRLIISIYNDQGHWSRIWLGIKELYNWLPKLLRIPFVLFVVFPRELRALTYSLVTLQPARYFRTWSDYRRFRGMSKWHDLVDWVGGLPFEFAKPEEVVFYLKDRGFELVGMTTCAGELGCNEYIFRKQSDTKDHEVDRT